MELVNTDAGDVDKCDNLPQRDLYHRRFFREGDTINIRFQNFDKYKKKQFISGTYIYSEN